MDTQFLDTKQRLTKKTSLGTAQSIHLLLQLNPLYHRNNIESYNFKELFK